MYQSATQGGSIQIGMGLESSTSGKRRVWSLERDVRTGVRPHLPSVELASAEHKIQFLLGFDCSFHVRNTVPFHVIVFFQVLTTVPPPRFPT